MRRWSPLMLGIVQRVVPAENVRSQFILVVERLRADNCALLADWSSATSLASHLSLKLADLLAAHLLSLLQSDAHAGWDAFELLYGDEIRRLARERTRGAGLAADEASDFEQDLKLALMSDKAAVLRRFASRGSFTGFVRIVTRNLAEDLIRSRLGRQREPEAVQRLDPLARRIYRLLHIEGHRADQLEHLVRDTAGLPVPAAVVAAALERLDGSLGAQVPTSRPRPVPLTVVAADGETIERPLPDSAPSPEALVIAAAERDRREAALDAVALALGRLPTEARTYLELRFGDPPAAPRAIAGRMGLPVEELYRRRRLWEAMMRRELSRLGVDEFPEVSV